MAIKDMFENYYDNQAEIILLSHDLKLMKDYGIPSSPCNPMYEQKASQKLTRPTEQAAIKNIESRDSAAFIEKRRDILVCEVTTVDMLMELLKPEEVRIWELRIREGKSWMQIADLLEKDQRTVKSNYEHIFEWLEKMHMRRFDDGRQQGEQNNVVQMP